MHPAVTSVVDAASWRLSDWTPEQWQAHLRRTFGGLGVSMADVEAAVPALLATVNSSGQGPGAVRP